MSLDSVHREVVRTWYAFTSGLWVYDARDQAMNPQLVPEFSHLGK